MEAVLATIILLRWWLPDHHMYPRPDIFCAGKKGLGTEFGGQKQRAYGNGNIIAVVPLIFLSLIRLTLTKGEMECECDLIWWKHGSRNPRWL